MSQLPTLMDYLPLFHDLRQRRCLVVGGGMTALRKLHILLGTGALVNVVAPEICTPIKALATNRNVSLYERCWVEDDLGNAALIIAATNDRSVNQRVAETARAANIPVNVVDDPELCTVIFPAIVDRSPIQIAISSSGTAPVLTRLLRGRIESLLPSRFGELAHLGARFRNRVKAALSGHNDRRAFWEDVFQGSIPELIYTDRLEEAERQVEAMLAGPRGASTGEVYLVGGGPGDPDLLTFRALRLMQQADIVLYDRLVSKEVLAMTRRDAERVYVGKMPGEHPITQDNINAKLVELARQGKRVLRLKGGDPFIFGRGGEEIAHLADHGIPFQVVPGITAASGCASYAGIPLTHRDCAQSVHFIAGHKRNGELDLDWDALVRPGQTLVFYMGLNGLETICNLLVGYGMASTMPAALIEKGTSTRQRVFTGDLATLPTQVRNSDAKAPTLLIVGEVVALREKLRWFGADAQNSV